MAAEIRRLLAECGDAVTVEEDEHGNLLARYRIGRATGTPTPETPRRAFVAHMDHPGWVRGRNGGEMQFLGGIGSVWLASGAEREEFGDFAMWRLPAFERRGDGLVRSRACDDLAGCAAIVDTMRWAAARKLPGHWLGIFTRAEEVGLAGAMRLARSGRVPMGTVIVSLETSALRAGAEFGAGPVVRTGDRMTVFDSEETGFLSAVARRAGVVVQRKLMDGGSCEATAFGLFGYRVCGITIPLGNPHNQGPDGQVEAEYVAEADFLGLIALLQAVLDADVMGWPTAAGVRKELKCLLEAGADRWGEFWQAGEETGKTSATKTPRSRNRGGRRA